MQLSETEEKMMRAAQKGYEGYCQYTGNKSLVTGDNLPEWNSLKPSIRNAWFSAANSILNYMQEA